MTKILKYSIWLLLAAGVVACNREINCPNLNCNTSAPEGTEISWLDFNSVKDVDTYFNCHMNTIIEHLGDTFLVEGYLFQPGMLVDDFNIQIPEGDNYVILYLSDTIDSSHHYTGKHILYMHCLRDAAESLHDYHWGQRVRCVVKLIGGGGIDQECDCCRGVGVRVISININK